MALITSKVEAGMPLAGGAASHDDRTEPRHAVPSMLVVG